jgi:lactoylglutathione lyase
MLYAADVERAVSFYREAFGFDVEYRWPPEGEPEYAFLRLEPLAIGVAAHSSAEGRRVSTLEGEARPGFELCVRTDDVDRAGERLVALGALELLPPGDQPWAERVAYFVDPEGNPIRVTAPLG